VRQIVSNYFALFKCNLYHYTPEKFEKEYAYAVRHAYGKEGKRVDYTPHTCMKCISSNPGAGEHHGCPYKTFGEEGLRAALGGVATLGCQIGYMDWLAVINLCF
jgi:DNA primase large subunit